MDHVTTLQVTQRDCVPDADIMNTIASLKCFDFTRPGLDGRIGNSGRMAIARDVFGTGGGRRLEHTAGCMTFSADIPVFRSRQFTVPLLRQIDCSTCSLTLAWE